MRKLLERLGGLGSKTPAYEPETREALCEHGLYLNEACVECTPNFRVAGDPVSKYGMHRKATREEIYAEINMTIEGGLDKAYEDGYNAGTAIAKGGSGFLSAASMSSAAKESYRMGVMDAFGDLHYDPETETAELDDDDQDWIDTFR